MYFGVKSDKFEDFRNRIDLIADFQFEEASNKIQVTRDGNYCMATGTYKPQIHVYDFDNLSLKFERHTDSENVDFCIISDDWTKSVHLQTDRTIEFHAQGGIHTRSRIPKFGRALTYNPAACDLMVGASGTEVYRLNLDQGRFLAPFELENEGVNTLDISLAHGLLGFGTESGIVEFWDPRTRKRVGQVMAGGGGYGVGSGVTSLSFREDGLNVAVGTHEGNTLLFDLRSPAPVLEKDQGYGFPIKKINWIYTDGSSDKIATTDRRIVKIWDRNTGDPFTAIEPSVDINDVAYLQNSGMFLFANEGMQMHSYYVPAIGPAPRWCEHLDTITEELEEQPTKSVYVNYKFVTRKELKLLHLDSYIGTNVVKAYMHGYFINQRLYEEAKLITDPFAHREYREREIAKTIAKVRESRIRTAGALPVQKVKVNKVLAANLMQKRTDKDKDPILDERFKEVFENPEFEIDEQSYEYRLQNPTKPGEQISSDQRRHNRLTAVENLEMFDSSSEEESEGKLKDVEEHSMSEKKVEKRTDRRSKQLESAKHVNDATVKMDAVHNTSANSGQELTLADQLALKQQQESGSISADITIKEGGIKGEMEMSFIPAPKKLKKKPRNEEVNVGDNAEAKDSGRKTQRYEGRRRASKNTFRGM